MKLHIFCAKCGTELEKASGWVMPQREYISLDAEPIALNPCPICASENAARSIARSLLQSAISNAEQVTEKPVL